jgi:hypothetical protein
VTVESEVFAMDAVRTRLSGPVIGCGDAWELAEFYASLLGWNVVDRSEDVPGGWALVRSPAGEHKREFQRTGRAQPNPKAVRTSDRLAETLQER